MTEIKQNGGGALVVGVIFATIGTIFFLVGVFSFFLTSGEGFEQYILFFIFGLMGLIFGGVGYGITFHCVRKTRKRNRLMSTGYRYEAEITNAYNNTSVEVNEQHPFVVECTYRNPSGETVLVKSGNLYSNVAIPLEEMVAQVFVDPQDPRDYYVAVYYPEAVAGHSANMIDYR